MARPWLDLLLGVGLASSSPAMAQATATESGEQTGGGVPLSLTPTVATTGAMLHPVQDLALLVPGAIVGLGTLFPVHLLPWCLLMPFSPTSLGNNRASSPQYAPTPGTLLACDWMDDIQAPGPSRVGWWPNQSFWLDPGGQQQWT